MSNEPVDGAKMNAIVLMAIGDKYVRSLHAVKNSFMKYAAYCNADLVVCDTPPDPSFKRNILCQKMLLPDLYRQYDWIAFIDLDILISHHTPSIFDYTDGRKAFSAVIDQRTSDKFKNVVTQFWKEPSILAETHESYFSDRGFPDHPFPKASINGGVWLCRPKLISEVFKAFYFSDFHSMPHEEAEMAYVAQKNNLFFEMDYRFNTQILYELFTPVQSPVVNEVKSRQFRRFMQYCTHSFPLPHMFPQAYEALVNRTLDNCYFLHFSGGFPFVNIKSDLTFSEGEWPADLPAFAPISATSNVGICWILRKVQSLPERGVRWFRR
jgi:hypothetical protein